MKNILAASIFFVAAQGAFAQTAANPVKWMAQDLKSQQCDVNLKQTRIIKGNLPGLGAVTVVAMPAEGCGGGNSWSTIVQAFYSNEHTEQTGVVSADKLTIEGNKIVIHGLDYADTDPRCCPSKHIAQKFVIQGNKLVETK